jgi:hypothetical protein
VTAEIIYDVLRALPKGSSAGPSGWTYEHITAALKDCDALNAASRFLNVIIGGHMPHLPDLLASTLIGLEKPGGNGVRPIAIGEAWLRLAGLCAMGACPEIGPSLAPLQLGVGVKGGSQCMGHAIRAGIAADPTCVTAQLDWRNAFNSVSRDAMLAAVAKRAPKLLPFAAWMYKQPAQLWVAGVPREEGTLISECGVRQGDPCGPLFFALTLQGPLERVRELNPDLCLVSYADDSAMQASPAVIIRSFRQLVTLGKDIGLEARLDKCGAYSADAAAAADTAAALGISHQVEGLVIAGTPVGTEAFAVAYTSSRADAARASVERMMSLPLNAQDKFTLLRRSQQHRLAHLQRTLEWQQISAAVGSLRDAALVAACEIFERAPLTDSAADTAVAYQLTLPLRLGGMGLLEPDEKQAQAAFLSAAAVTQVALRNGPEQFRPFSGPLAPGLQDIWAQLRADAELWPDEAGEAGEECITRTLPGVQRLYSRLAADRRFDALLASCDPSTTEGERTLARLRSCACGPAGLWLDALPTSPALQLLDKEFVSAARHRLGSTQMPSNAPAVQCFCGVSVRPGNTDHAMVCSTISGAMTLRHDILKGTWRRIVSRGGFATSVEPRLGQLRDRRDRSGRAEERGDILLALPNALTVADVSVIHPAAQSYVRGAAAAAGSAAALRDQQKRTRYEQSFPGGYAFTPLVVETYGRMGKPAMELLNTIATQACASGTFTRGDFVGAALRELSVALCKGNAVMYRAGLTVLARCSGHAFLDGATVPFADA